MKGLLSAIALLALYREANAIAPDALISLCTERALADNCPENATADCHTEAVLGYPTAALDSLHEENPACHYVVSGREFSPAFNSSEKRRGHPAGVPSPRNRGDRGERPMR